MIKIKTLTMKDTDRIALHMQIVYEIILKLEKEYDEIAFNKDAKMYNDNILNAAGAVERLWRNAQ